MRRPPPRAEPPQRRFRRDMPRPEGPFDRLLRTRRERDPAPIIIGGTVAFLALVIFVVVLGSSLLGGDSGSSPRNDGSDKGFDLGQGITGKFAPLPALPPGLQAVSNYIQFTVDKNNAPIVSDIEIPLNDKGLSATTGLGFYTYFEGRWQRVAEVKAIQNGNAAGDFATLPGNVAVLR